MVTLSLILADYRILWPSFFWLNHLNCVTIVAVFRLYCSPEGRVYLPGSVDIACNLGSGDICPHSDII